MIDSSSITPPFLALDLPLRVPALDGDHCSPLLLKCEPLLHLCPCAVHLFGLVCRADGVALGRSCYAATLPFIVYWQTPYSAAEHQARI